MPPRLAAARQVEGDDAEPGSEAQLRGEDIPKWSLGAEQTHRERHLGEEAEKLVPPWLSSRKTAFIKYDNVAIFKKFTGYAMIW